MGSGLAAPRCWGLSLIRRQKIKNMLMGLARRSVDRPQVHMDASRLLLSISVFILALTQIPAALESMSVLECQNRFMSAAASGGELLPAVAVKFSNGTSERLEAF